jgi:coproporphyrinogen III oxidase
MLETLPLSAQTIANEILNVREKIIEAFLNFETIKTFERTPWSYHHKGGGEMAVLRGDVFEKAAVNFSFIEGQNFPMQDGSGPFIATGVSLITHMKNPYVPTSHMNIRFIQTKNSFWVAGGYDLTPMGFEFHEDTSHFHKMAKDCLDRYSLDFYPDFKKNADEYFYIPHRKKTRGVGGIFFDHFNSSNLEKDVTMIIDIAKSFIEAYIPIVAKRKDTPFTEEDKILQKKLRAHYVEFNLLYDRGTKFGFLSGGNPDAILCSMPPEVMW